MKKIILPLPPTDNRLRMPVKIGKRIQLILTPEYRAWIKEVNLRWLIKYNDIEQLNPSFENQLKIKYNLFLNNKRKDISNFEKATKDVLSKRLYADDKWVKLDLQLPVEIDAENPRIEIIVD